MAEFEEKLGAILNNPQAMSQIMALAQSLGGNSSEKSTETPVSATSSPPASESGENTFEPVSFGETGETSDISPFDGLNLDPRLLSIGMQAISAYRDQDNSKALLLQALRPFVKEERAAKVDKAVQITKISKAIRAILDGFKGGKEGV